MDVSKKQKLCGSQCKMFLLLVGVIVASGGCAHTGSHLYRVSPGDSISQISSKLKVPQKAIVRENDISDASKIYVGQELRIPVEELPLPPWSSAHYVAPEIGLAIIPPWQDSRGHMETDRSKLPPLRSSLKGTRFIWPLRRKPPTLSSGFGYRRRHFHYGIDLAAKKGTPIYAARSGRIIFSGIKRGYGRIVIVKHSDNFATVYAHNLTNLVKASGWVRRGDPVALVGESGNATGPHLHFEVWHKKRAVNPVSFLPKYRLGTG